MAEPITALWLAEQQRHLELDRQREQIMIAAMLTGEESTLLGMPVIIHLEWPEGLPHGMDEAALRVMGEQMRAAAQGTRWIVAGGTPGHG